MKRKYCVVNWENSPGQVLHTDDTVAVNLTQEDAVKEQLRWQGENPSGNYIIEEQTAQTFSAVVETGSCCASYRSWEESATCGHRHRTVEDAEACLRGLAAQSSRWHFRGTIHDQNGERVDRSPAA